MKRKFDLIAVLVFLLAFVSIAALADCNCTNPEPECGFGTPEQNSYTVGVSLAKVLGPSGGFTVNLTKYVPLVQVCTCVGGCCPDKDAVHPVGYATVETQETIPDPVIPNRGSSHE